MNFLHKVGEALLRVHGNDFSHVQIVLPTHRACYFLRCFFLNKATNLWLPQMFTLPEWAESISGIKRADNLELILLLCELAKEIGMDEPTEELLSLARVLCSDFEDMDMHMVKPESFFRTLNQLAALKVFGTEDDKGSKREEYLLFWKRFERLYHLHRQRLLEQKKGDIGIIMRYVGENIENLIPSGQALYFIGFDVLTRAEEKIIKHLCEQGKAQAFWDTDNYYLKKQYHEAGYFFRKYQKEWKLFKPSDNDYILSAPKKIQIISATRSIGQVKAAAELIASLVNENEANRTVIVVNDEKLLQPLKYYLPQLECGYNLTMGLPILRSQSGEFFQILFHALENSERLHSQSQPTAIYYKDLHALMLHPFCAFIVKRDIIRQIDEILRKKNLVFTEISFLREIGFPDIVSNLFLAQNDKSFLKSLKDLTAFLYTSLLQHRSMDEEAEFMYKICEIIARCDSLLLNHSFSSKAIRNILKDSFRFTRIPFEGEPATGVQIMGLMETRCLDFDNVIMLSANEGIMPPTKIAKSYIPYALRSEALFTHKERDCKISYLFYRLLQHAKNIFLIYDADVNTYGTGEKSRFLQQIEYELAQHTNISISQKVFNINSAAQYLPPPIVIEKNPDILKKIQDHLKNGISPSALSTFINCSLQYYFKYIAGLKEPEDIEEDMDSSSMGTAIHSVLENLYQGAIQRELSAEYLKQILKNSAEIERLLSEAFKEKFDETALKQGKNHLLYKISLKMITLCIENDLARIEDGSKIKILKLEEPLEVNIHNLRVPVKIKGISDRVELSDNNITILDYKSGSVKDLSIKSSAIEDLFEKKDKSICLQLMIYAWMYMHQHPEVQQLRAGVIKLRQAEENINFLTLDDDVLLSGNMLHKFEELLRAVIEKILDELQPFEQTKEESNCKYCPYIRICNRHQ